MNRQNLAAKLLSAESPKERKLLLAQNKVIADSKLAWIIKELCYAAWTSEPTKAQKAARALLSLYRFSSTDEIKALSLWVSGISDLTKGKLESAVQNLGASTNVFIGMGRDHESAQPRVASLIAVAMLGRYDEALKIGKDALTIFKKYGDELAAGKIEMNLSNIVARRELHTESINYCLSAQKRFAKLGEKKWLAMAQNDLARGYAQINDFRKAERFYAQALRTAREAKMIVTQAEIEASMGNLALFRGKYADALKFLELSRRKYLELNMPHETATAELEIADIYAEINLTEEAFEIYGNVIRSLRRLKMRREEALARANFGRAAAVLKRPNRARKEFDRADKLFAALKNPTAQSSIKLDLAFLELSERNFARVLDLVEKALATFTKDENFRQTLIAEWLRAEALTHLEFVSEAADLLREIHRKASKTEQVNAIEASLNSLGKLALQTGDVKKAAAYFKKAIKLIENSRSPFAAEQFRRAFMATRLEPFENLVRLYLAKGRLKDAFVYVEKARSRTLLESLFDDTAKNSEAKTPTRLKSEAVKLREELNWFYNRQANAEGAVFNELREKIHRCEKELIDVTRQIESTEAFYVSRENKKKDRQIDLGDLQRQLGPKRAIVEYVRFDGKLSAFVITDKKIRFAADLVTEEEVVDIIEALHFQFDGMRYGKGIAAKFEQQMKSRTDVPLQKLYLKLVKPIEDHLQRRDLIIVPVAALHYIPFHALYDGGNYLIESCEVHYAPSSAVWQVLDDRPRIKPKNALLIGFADEHIPLVNREIETLKKIFPKSKSFTGADATFSAYLDNAPRFDVLHLACHGQFRPENPMFSSLHLSDGWVTVRDICAQKLRAGLVTLSACETGMNKIYAGDELLGLARGFLSAGANSLILSLWTVSDEAAATLMKEFYEHLQRGEPSGASLRLAQIDFIQRSAHPYFWSPFVFIGA